MKFRNFVFTINNPTENDITLIKNCYEDGYIRYVHGGYEVGEKTKTLHIQGHCNLHDQMRRKAIKKYFPRTEPQHMKADNVYDSINYTKKGEMLKSEWKKKGPDGKPLREKGKDFGKNYQCAIELGKPPKQGERKDLDNIQKELLDGVPLHDIIWRCKNAQQQKYAENLYRCPQVPKPHRTWRTEAHVYWGKANTGKTYKARESAQKYADKHGYRVWYSGENGKWFSDYNGQEVVVMEDFDDSQYTLGVLLRLLDNVPYRVGGKYQPEEEWLAKRVYFSTNFDPQGWYGNCDPKRREALLGNENCENGRITFSRCFYNQRKDGRSTTIHLTEDDPYEEDEISENSIELESFSEETPPDDYEIEIRDEDLNLEIDSKSVSEVGRVIYEPAETKKIIVKNKSYIDPIEIDFRKKLNKNHSTDVDKILEKKNEILIKNEILYENNNKFCKNCGEEKPEKYRIHDKNMNEIIQYKKLCEECNSEKNYEKQYRR
nr:putative replication associated protein [Crucivirus sp.]